MSILVLNVGSATCKWKFFNATTQSVLAQGLEEGPNALEAAIKKIKTIEKTTKIQAIGHRVVHGGKKFYTPTRITQKVLKELKKLEPLAPIHNPANIAGIETCQKIFPHIPQIAVFDTAFHATIPSYAKQYAIPEQWHKKYNIERYGFHGTSHAYVSQIAIAQLKKAGKPWHRLITCHLGNGCSITAIKNGKSIDTSMGLTPLEGLIMGTRSGDIDPGIIFYLARQGKKIAEIENELLHESGLKALAGTHDMRKIWAKAQHGNAKAQHTITTVSYRIGKYVGAFTAALGGLDALVFTGGMGVPAFYIRQKVVKMVHAITPKTTILTIPTDEEKMIAQNVKKYIRQYV